MGSRVVLTMMVVAASACGRLQAGENAWHTDLAKARQVAEESNLPLLVYCTTSHCPHCVRMKQTLAAASVDRQVKAGFVAVWIDYGTDSATCAKLGVRAYPTTVILRPNQGEVKRVVGYQGADQFLNTLRQAAVVVAARDAKTVK